MVRFRAFFADFRVQIKDKALNHGGVFMIYAAKQFAHT
jgi:hypothetical protein